VENHIQIALNWNLARSLIARAADGKFIAHEQIPSRGIDEFVDWIDDEKFVWGRSWLLYAWHPGIPSSSGDDVVRGKISIKRDDYPTPADNVRPGCGPIVKTENDRKRVHRFVGGVFLRETDVELNRCW
jgi:hypothetical protein